MAALLGAASVADDPPDWWPAPLAAGPDQTLIRVSCWVSALGRVLDAIEVAAAEAGVRPLVEGSAGAGVLYLRFGPGAHGAQAADSGQARFVAKLREAVAGQRCAVTVLAATPTVRAELAAHGGMAGPVPGLALMQSVKDRFDPRHLLAPGQFPATG
jgi:glycolate oxidase FAD binding subunit